MKNEGFTFREKLAALSSFIYFDVKDNLREKAKDASAFKLVIREAIELLRETVDEEERQFLLGTIGNLFRITGEPELGIVYLEEALVAARVKKDLPREIVSLIRLGEALKYAGRKHDALSLFEEALMKSKGEAFKYKDFALQHKGKCFLELERFKEAEACFKETLHLRKEKGDQSLIDSTMLAIDFVGKRK